MKKLSIAIWAPVLLCASMLMAQNSADTREPIAEIFAGYSGYNSGFNVTGVPAGLTSGFSVQAIANPEHRGSVVVDFSCHAGTPGKACGVIIGGRYQRPLHNLHPFAGGGIGLQYFEPKGLGGQIFPAFNANAGLDVRLTPRISVRPIEIAYIGSFYDLKSTSGSSTSQSTGLNGARFQAGILFDILRAPVLVARAKCSVDAAEVEAGAKVRVTVLAEGYRSDKLSYSYHCPGIETPGSESSVVVDTTGAQPGKYVVSATVSERRKYKKSQDTGCDVEFMVREPAPPQIVVSTDKELLRPGESATISVKGSSSDNRPLTYTCAADAGKLTGNSPEYSLDSTGLTDTNINVTCKVKDDRGLQSEGKVVVRLESPQSAPAPAPESAPAPASESAQTKAPASAPSPKASEELAKPVKFSTLQFVRYVQLPSRVDNQAKAELDRFADALLAAPTAKAFIIGKQSETESRQYKALQMASQRAVNVKDYLQHAKGIDPQRLQLRVSQDHSKTVELWIVPNGADLNKNGLSPVDEEKIKAIPHVPLRSRTVKKPAPEGHAAAHPAAKGASQDTAKK
jgi:outer membrane protein OmpA-like peptidoglycan-associated protein